MSVCVYVSTHPGICDCLHVFRSAPNALFLGSDRSTFQRSLLYFDILKSFGRLQGTIKLSNGHSHYVKAGLYCQLFEHSWLPGSEDKMSGAQYFRAIKLSAFLFSLITF